MTEIIVESKGCDWYSAIKLTTGCWLATLKEPSPDTVVVRDSGDPTDPQELLACYRGRAH